MSRISVFGCRIATMCALILPATGYAQEQRPEDLMQTEPPVSTWTGQWLGFGNQGNRKWSMEVTFDTENSARVDYATIPCSGALRLLGKETGKAVYSETLTRGIDNCIAGGMITFTAIDDSTMSFFKEAGGQQASGTLRRVTK